jgi:tetratricopeptide (TPR) repeat protein
MPRTHLASRFLARLLGYSALACLSLTAGCAGPGTLGGRWFSWAKPSARTQAEIEQARAEQAAGKLDHPERVHLAHAQWREQSGDFAAARTSYGYVLEQQPDSIEALIGLGRIDQLSGRFDEAERGFRKALDLRPNSPLAQDALGQFYAADERWETAIPLLRSAAQAEPDVATYQHHLAVALARSGHVDEALPHFTRSVGAAEAHYNVAYLLHEQGQDKQAIRHLETALRIKPDLPSAVNLLAELTGTAAPPSHALAATRTPQLPAQPPVQRFPVTEIRQTGSQVYEESKSRYAQPAAYHVTEDTPRTVSNAAPTTTPTAAPAAAPPVISPGHSTTVTNPMPQTVATAPRRTAPPQLVAPPTRPAVPPQPATAPVTAAVTAPAAIVPMASAPAPTGWRPHGSAQLEQRANQRPAP